jgi:hypothetical protein
MNCNDCPEFGSYWHFDQMHNKQWENWHKNWLGCKIGKKTDIIIIGKTFYESDPKNCPMNKLAVKA